MEMKFSLPSPKLCSAAISIMTAGTMVLCCADIPAQEIMPADGLAYDKGNLGVAPIPPAERLLQSVEARPVAIVGKEGQTLEGAIFDAQGNLLFCNVSDGKIMRLAPDGRLDTVLQLNDFSPGGLALHNDGRIFVAAMNQARRQGIILAFSPDDKKTETILPHDAGYLPNDLVFDRNGGFYFSDFKGSATILLGGIYYVSPDYKEITPVIPNMAQANGVALSPDGKTLWATEYARNLLHRITLESPTRAPLTGSKTPYSFIGSAPDSMRVDSKGNVYVAIVGQGRVIIFNPIGLPIGQILLPGRDKGLKLSISRA